MEHTCTNIGKRDEQINKPKREKKNELKRVKT